MALLLTFVGCQNPVPPPEQHATTLPSSPSHDASFRPARPADIQMLISTRKPGPDGFPVAVVELWNNSSDPILFEYHPGCLTLHCDSFEQRGPANVFSRRREVLDPQEEIDFAMPAGGWNNAPTTGPHELMLPSQLSPGKYPIWASITLPGGKVVESERDTFEVAAPESAPSPAAKEESFRPAETKDLRVMLATRPNPADGFPLAQVNIYNTSNDQIIVGYEPESVVLHCGPYEKHAPPVGFVERREILRPKQPLEFDVAAGGWIPSPNAGGQDLLIPTKLPPGKYQTWASFRLPGNDATTIASPRDWVVVP